ncbi:MAG: flavodoxin family protein [Candidatus Omnitrophica bacterium]|nr:flavodoxin family protein [Candidatus Omnitrophota bacterium]
MAKVLIVYYSRTGNTKKMAQLIGEGLKAQGHNAVIKETDKVCLDDLKSADGIIIGSPTYYGGMAGHIKILLDESVKFHGSLDGKPGAAFSTAVNIAGGSETTILDILNAMLIHGMIIQGDPSGSHYGPVSIGAPDERARAQCQRFAQRFARLLVMACK